MNKNFIKKILLFILITVVLWLVVTAGFIQRFKCPEMTETELILHIPKSFMLDFKNCN